jgi:DAPG hydrolase-like protein
MKEQTMDPDMLITAETWEDGVTELSPQRLLLRARDDLPGVSPAMFAWFFAHLDRDLYLRFHPVDHEHFAWLRGKEPGRYVGATHLTHQRYGGTGPQMRAAITFREPAEVLDVAALAAAGAMAVCATVRLVGEDGREQDDEGPRFAHVALPRDWGTELRSVWWLPVDAGTDREWVTEGRLRHVHEEFGHLARFLPEVADPAWTSGGV